MSVPKGICLILNWRTPTPLTFMNPEFLIGSRVPENVQFFQQCSYSYVVEYSKQHACIFQNFYRIEMACAYFKWDTPPLTIFFFFFLKKNPIQNGVFIPLLVFLIKFLDFRVYIYIYIQKFLVVNKLYLQEFSMNFKF